MAPIVNRRQSLAALLAGAAMPALLPQTAQAQASHPAGLFRHGVASGDPAHDSVVLWTRVTTGRPALAVQWEISTSPDFSSIAGHGEAVAHHTVDHTVKIVAQGLAAGVRYHYRFRAGDEWSPVGRTMTLPSGRLDRLGIALASCSNYVFGHFHAYDAIARDSEVDMVLHTGDYIYEYGNQGWGAEVVKKSGRPHDPPHEIVTLDDYRRRHAQYKRDPGAQAMHAAHPLLACWDDHEVANNPWMHGAQNHQSATEGSWNDRRTAAIRAYYEWMPVREPEAGQSRLDFWRSYSFGDLATLVTMETRHTGRGEQVDYARYADSIRSTDDALRFERTILEDPDRTMISPAMERFLSTALAQSKTQGQPWRLIGNAIPMARTRVPDVVALGLIADPAKAPSSPASPSLEVAAKELAWKGRWNLPFYTDTWDGYPVARERFYATARAAGVSDLLVLTGDSHSFWANILKDREGKPMGLELGTAGITSPGDFLASGFDPVIAEKLDRAFASHNSEVRWTDNFHQGYVRLVLGRTEGRADFIGMSSILNSDYEVKLLRSEQILHIDGSLSYRT